MHRYDRTTYSASYQHILYDFCFHFMKRNKYILNKLLRNLLTIVRNTNAFFITCQQFYMGKQRKNGEKFELIRWTIKTGITNFMELNENIQISMDLSKFIYANRRILFIRSFLFSRQ